MPQRLRGCLFGARLLSQDWHDIAALLSGSDHVLGVVPQLCHRHKLCAAVCQYVHAADYPGVTTGPVAAPDERYAAIGEGLAQLIEGSLSQLGDVALDGWHRLFRRWADNALHFDTPETREALRQTTNG